jgi:hypothetical protein
MQIFGNKKLKERAEWDEMRRLLSAYLSESEIEHFGETQGHSLDFVELVMGLE